MTNKNQMSGLYPIVRRVRRPLLPVEALPAGQHADAKPQAVTTRPEAKAAIGQQNEPGKASNAQRVAKKDGD